MKRTETPDIHFVTNGRIVCGGDGGGLSSVDEISCKPCRETPQFKEANRLNFERERLERRSGKTLRDALPRL
jgi:hypothetical protein